MGQKQTAVEWLITELNPELNYIPITQWNRIRDLVQRAKEMEKQQSIDFARHCLDKANRTFDLDILTSFIDVHQYYNEEYGK